MSTLDVYFYWFDLYEMQWLTFNGMIKHAVILETENM